MKLNRKSVTIGLVGLGLVGALAGAGIAQAATGGPTPASASTTSFSGGTHHFGDRSGMAFGQNTTITSAASYLGLSQAELQTQLQAGKSLADIAKAQGKSVSGLEDAMVAALKRNLDTNSTLAADQKAATLAQLKSRIDTMVNTTHPSGEGTGMGMGTGMGR